MFFYLLIVFSFTSGIIKGIVGIFEKSLNNAFFIITRRQIICVLQ